MAIARGEVDLSAVEGGDYTEGLPMRVAATHEGQILGSTVIQPSKGQRVVPFELEFTPRVNPGARWPCPIRFIVGPNVGDRELLALDVAYKNHSFVQKGGKGEREAAPPAAKGKGDAPPPAEAAEGDEARALNTEGLRVDVGRIEVMPHIYRCWLFCCRTYHIRGRVVCRNWSFDPEQRRWVWCDDAAPGAEVDIYDVDRFLWWYSEDRITTVTTQIDGTFDATFVWCCRPWNPWWWPHWRIDDDVLRHIRELLAERHVTLPPIGPDPDPSVIQGLVSALTAREQAARATFAQAAPAFAASVESGLSTSAETLRAVLPASEKLTALRVWPWFDWNDCAPDVIFRVRQRCHGREEIIHNETVAQTRWNIPTTVNVTLLANDKACCVPRCHEPECPDCVRFTYVGCSIPVDQIAGASLAGPPDLRGYWGADTQLDRPLYDNLPVHGKIGPDIDYFKVQYAKDGGPWLDLPTPQFAGFARRYLTSGGFSPYITFAPGPRPVSGGGSQTVIMTRNHYEELNAPLPTFFGDVWWDDPDYLFDFASDATPALGDGLYQLRLVGYATDAGDNLLPASERVLLHCGERSVETMFLRIDNDQQAHPAADHTCGGTTVHLCTNEPEAYIRSLIKNEGLPGQDDISVCDIVDLEPTDTLTVHFTVTVPANSKDGHLGGYEMVAEYGAAEQLTLGTGTLGAACPTDNATPRGAFEADPPSPAVQVGPTYAEALTQGAPRPFWYGGTYKVTLRGCDFPTCCAYEIRLRAWKRTTNGCNAPEWTHWNRYHNTFTILRRDLCPDICRDNTPVVN
jgi:hypothetical protein